MPSHQPIVCRAVINATDDYIDGSCTADAILQIDNHLKSCSECSAYVDHYRQVMQLTRSAMQLDGDDRQVPDGMIERTLEKLKKHDPSGVTLALARASNLSVGNHSSGVLILSLTL